MRLTYGTFSMMFAADVEELGAQNVARRGSAVRCTVLKVPHHGSASATHTDFFRVVHPKLALISVGAHNEFGHPTRETLQALREVGAKIMRTDYDGAITLHVNPPRWWVRGYVGNPRPRHYSGRT